MNRILFVFILAIINFPLLFAQINPYADYRELFGEVQKKKVFDDQKTFVDCTPRFPADTINSRYDRMKHDRDFDLKSFVMNNFIINQYDTSSIFDHIRLLWNYLTRRPHVQDPLS